MSNSNFSAHKESCGNIAKFIHLCIFYGHFPTIRTEFRRSHRDWLAKPRIFPIWLCSDRLLTPDLRHWYSIMQLKCVVTYMCVHT